MHPNEKLITQFYEAFQRKDVAAMAACYHPEIEFTDEVFRGLQGERAVLMWRMLNKGGGDLTLNFSDVHADDSRGSAKWVAEYTFSVTGRHVRNEIEAAFEFRDGFIWRHRDRFDARRWTRQAFGPVGAIPGVPAILLPLLRSRVLKELDKDLVKYGPPPPRATV